MQTYANQLLEEEYVVDTIQIQTSRVEQNVGEGEDKDLCPADMGIPIGMPNLNLKLLTELLNYQVLGDNTPRSAKTSHPEPSQKGKKKKRKKSPNGTFTNQTENPKYFFDISEQVEHSKNPVLS